MTELPAGGLAGHPLRGGPEGARGGPGRTHRGRDRRLVEDARLRLLDLISSGALQPGDRLGTERELAARLSVSRSTLRQVLAVLAQAGTVRRVPGRVEQCRLGS